MGSAPRSGEISDPPLRVCSLCNRLATRWYAYDERPVAEIEGMTLSASKILCGLCLDGIVKRPPRE
jgi:hypothetical protein